MYDSGLQHQEQAFTPVNLLLDKEQWHEVLNTAVLDAHKTDEPLSVVFADFNYFKDVNDELGHDVGDMVIEDMRELVDKVVKSLRTKTVADETRPLDLIAVSDVIPIPMATPTVNELIDAKGGRIGGDEFAILAEADEAGAKIIVERLRHIFADYISQPDKTNLAQIGLDLAIGTATLQPNMTSSRLLKLADEAMYQDKLDRLPELTANQQTALKMAEFILSQAGIRKRDFSKYLRKLGS